MEHIIFLFIFLFFFSAIGILFGLLFKSLKDIYLVYFLFISDFLFFEFLNLPLDLNVIIILTVFFSILFRRKLSNSQKTNLLRNIWPLFIFFGIALFWFLDSGSLPNYFYENNSNDASGNFTIYLNILCNFFLIILPFFLRITIAELYRLLKVIMFIIIIQFFLESINQSGFLNIYLPFFVSTEQNIIEISKSSIVRNYLISELSFLLTLFTLFFYDNKRHKVLLVFSAIGLNLIYGGGRIDLISSLLVVLYFYFIIKSNKTSFIKLTFYLVGVLLSFIIIFPTISTYMTDDQNERFLELLSPSESAELDKSKDNVRVAMWGLSINGFLESPVFGNGISKISEDHLYKSTALRNVSVGSSHQTYLSILYVFGLVGLISFLLALKKLFFKLKNLRKIKPYDTVFNFIYCFFIIKVFFMFNVGGGINNVDLMFYFFFGYIFSIFKIDFKPIVK